ncbi:MAG: hypothetical protein SGILL_002575 [Bacillariaceae sp.]
MQNITGHILSILSGNGVITWEYAHDDPNRPLQEPITRYPYGELPLSSICWNHNRMCLATCSAISTEEQLHDNIQLISSQSGNRLDSFQHDKDMSSSKGAVANTLQFGGKSRYLCIGDESGSVVLWDLKKKLRVRHFLHPDHPSRQVSLDPSDTYVLSLSPDALFVYNLREGKLVQTLVPPDTSDNVGEPMTVFTKFCTSALEPSTVAVGTNDGSVFLYDIRRSISNSPNEEEGALPISALIRRHSGAVTGLAFSPIHANVLVTSGSDGTIKMFNIRTAETIKQFQPDEVASPINTLHLHAGIGSLCSIGCESGDVFVFDLQLDGDGCEVIAQINVAGPVEQVAFIPPPRNKELNAPQSTPAKSVNSLSMAGPTPAKFRLEQHNTPSIATRSLASTSMAPSLESPSSSTVLKAQENIPSASATAAPSPASSGPFPSIARKSPLSPRRTVIVQAARQLHKTEPKLTKTRSPGSSPVRKGTIGSSSPTKSNTDVNSQPLAIRSRSARSTFMKVRTGTLSRNSYSVSSSPQQENIPEEQRGGKMNTEEIRDVVREEVENLQDEMEEQLRNLHMDMIAQFHQQSQEMNTSISKHLTTIDRLTEENQRLREENDLLRHGS